MAACSAVKGAGEGGELAWLHVGIGLKISLGYDFVAVNISQNPAVTAKLKVFTNLFGYDFARL